MPSCGARGARREWAVFGVEAASLAGPRRDADRLDRLSETR